jgi:hypothetical protein
LQTQVLQVRSSIDRALDWFLGSGIQEPSGGVARYYRTDTLRNATVSTEITGYAVSALVYAFKRHGERAYSDAAVRSGRFLMEQAWDGELGAFPFEHSDNGRLPQHHTYFFDSGIIVRGLIKLWSQTKDAVYLEAARRGGLAMLRDFIREDAIHPVLSLPGKEPLPQGAQWSRQPGCYQLKSALAWHELYEETGETEFLQAYEYAYTAAISSHDTFLPAPDGPEKTMDRLHAYCYFLEGALPFAERPGCRSAIATGIARVSGYLRDIEPVFVRSDVYAQLLRIRVYAEVLAGVPLDEEQALVEISKIGAFQCDEAGRRVRGGFWFGEKAGVTLPFVNPVSTAFCMQAQTMWQDRRSGRSTPDRRLLI